MEIASVQELIDAGVHFGCRVARRNPRMEPYIYGRRNMIHIIDLRETLKGILRAQNLLYHMAAEGSSILWVGTKRQIIYDDFAAVGEDLIARKITSPKHLGIFGGSNGGLLMGVEMIQRPDLWNAVAIQVPLLDMIRISKIAAGASWQGEYGNVNTDPEAMAFWQKTSPYQNLERGADYPEPFIFTTTKDDRTGPQHARKFAARMEEYGLPFYYYENTEGGHGSGADIKQSARTNALTYTYFMEKLMGPPAGGTGEGAK